MNRDLVEAIRNYRIECYEAGVYSPESYSNSTTYVAPEVCFGYNVMAEVDGKLYSLTTGSYPTMCGGNTFAITPPTPSKDIAGGLWEVKEGDMHTPPMQYERGVGIMAGVVVKAMVTEELERMLEDQIDTNETGDVLCVPLKDVNLYVVHSDKGPNSEYGDGTCNYCGDSVDEDYYCHDCEAYSEEGYEDEDYMIEGRDRDEWVDYHAPEIGTYYTGVTFTTTESVAGTVVCHFSWDNTGAVEPEDVVDELVDMLTPIMEKAPHHVLFISSNVGEGGSGTATIMALLWQYRDELSERGIMVDAPDTLATNPNERNHLIDSFVIYRKEDRDEQ